jgi:fatty-acyl-CoA synthase
VSGWLERIGRDLRYARLAGRAALTLAGVRPDAETTVADAIEDRAASDPERTALVFEDRELGYRELDRAANRVARWARTQGLGPGDVVALLMENRPEYVVHWLGLAKIGVTTALINTHLTGRPLAHSLGVAGAKHLVLGAELAERWAGAREQMEAPPQAWASGGAVPGAEDLDAVVAERSPVPLGATARAGVRARDDLFYIYTSGTTGLPKAARFSHYRFLTTGRGAAAMTRLGPRDRMYVPLPLYHTAGGVMALGAALLSGAPAVLTRRFSASRFWEDCVRYDVTVFQYIGELCRYLLHAPHHPDERRHRVRLCVGNGLRPEIWQAFQERFGIPDIVEFYGATEGNVVFLNVDNRVGSVGRMPGLLRRAVGIHLVRFDVEAQEVVRGPDGFCIECGPGEAGEAIGRISAATRFEGYTSEEATERKILRDVFREGDAYFRTGDLLRRDEDDYFYFVDRIGDTFRWKGENVATSEVAEALSTVAGVEEANVYGVEVPGTDGRAGMAALVTGEGFDPDALARALARQLPAYARPVFLRIRPELEVTGTFKHRKVDLAREGFDPARVADPLWFLDPEAGTYVPLEAAVHERIVSGAVRL